MQKDNRTIAADNAAFINGKVPEDIGILKLLMMRARIMIQKGENDPLALQAARILLAPDLPEVWQAEQQKIMAAVRYINAVRNSLELSPKEVQQFNNDLFRSSLSTPSKGNSQLRNSAKMVYEDEDEVQVKKLDAPPSPKAERPASKEHWVRPLPNQQWATRSSHAKTFNNPVVPKSLSSTYDSYKDIAVMIKKYSSTVAKINDYGFREKLGDIQHSESKQKAVDKLLKIIIDHLHSKDEKYTDKDPKIAKSFLKHGGENLIKGLLEIKDVALTATQARDLKSELNRFYNSRERKSMFDKIDAKSPDLREEREERWGDKINP